MTFLDLLGSWLQIADGHDFMDSNTKLRVNTDIQPSHYTYRNNIATNCNGENLVSNGLVWGFV